ncbi:MAG: pyruvate ferredoxin oxidoreductase subunit gamma [Methanosarcinales archaeon]
MKQIRIHGRGGQGSVTAAELLAVAAFEDGMYSQAFPAFGVERRGAPVMAFVRLDNKPIRLRSQVNNPDYVIVQDATLTKVVDVDRGITPKGMILVNTEKNPESLNLNPKSRQLPAIAIRTLDATKIAMEIIGKPIVNTTLLGAFASATKLIKIEYLKKAVKNRFPGKVGEINAIAVEKAYELMEAET